MKKHEYGTPFRVMEIYGPVIQGEGIDVGIETIFLRLYGCNLSCVWCDTAHSWDESKYYDGIYKELTIPEIVEEVRTLAGNYTNKVIITGGEPLLHNHIALTDLCFMLHDIGIHYVAFETNGTILPTVNLINVTKLFTVSPKLSSSKNPPFKPSLIRRWIEKVGVLALQFKFVIANQQDANEAVQLIKEANSDELRTVPIIFQPEETANNYRELPLLLSKAFENVGLNKRDYNIRYIPQVHKIYGIR